MVSKEVCSVKEIAEYLGLCETKIRQLIKQKEIPFVKLGGSYRFYLPAIQEWLRERSAMPVIGPVTDHVQQITNRMWNSPERK